MQYLLDLTFRAFTSFVRPASPSSSDQMTHTLHSLYPYFDTERERERETILGSFHLSFSEVIYFVSWSTELSCGAFEQYVGRRWKTLGN